MRIRWRGLELPARVVRDESISSDMYGHFTIEPFERGFGTTIGNSLRRILLSSLEGAAVTEVRIAGAEHEFCSLPGVLEDVTDIILNIKALVVDVDADEPKKMRLQKKKAGKVRAGEFEADAAIKICNPDQLIATLTDDVPFSIEVTVTRGRGYIPAVEHIDEESEIGVIPIDSLFSPVTRVRYRTEDTRVGQKTNYDRLVLEVWTKGTVRPEHALVEAAKILRKHLNPFVQYHDLGLAFAAAGDPVVPQVADDDDELQHKLDLPLSTLDLSVRASNCLEVVRISTIGELVSLGEPGLLQLRSFGETSLEEVRRKLGDIGLSLANSSEEGPPQDSGANTVEQPAGQI